MSDNNRRAKYYALTRRGRGQLEAETEAWRKLTVAVILPNLPPGEAIAVESLAKHQVSKSERVPVTSRVSFPTEIE